jgi:hypothetical protein
MKQERINIAIYESKTSERVMKFANKGEGMSKRWWNKVYSLHMNGSLWGVYQTKGGKLRINSI